MRIASVIRIIFSIVLFIFLANTAIAQQDSPPADWMVIHARHSSRQGQNIISVAGRTSYPDGTFIYIALAFRETRLEWTRVEVSRGSFYIDWTPRKRLFPAYFIVEAVYYPERQPAHLSCKLEGKSKQSVTYPIRVGTPEDVRKFREARLKEYERRAERLKTLYDKIKAEYSKQVADISKINARAWLGKKDRWRNALTRERESFIEHREEWMTERYPDIADAFVGVIEFIGQFLESATSFILDPSPRVDPHLGEQITPSIILEDFDLQMTHLFDNIHKAIEAKRAGENEELLRHIVVSCFGSYQNLNAGFHSLSKKRDLSDLSKNWAVVISKWEKEFTAIVNEVRRLGESPMPDTVGGVMGCVVELADMLTTLKLLYDAQVTMGKTDSTPEIEKQKRKFLESYVTIMEKLRVPDILGETFAALGEGVPKLPSETTPDVHEMIMEKITALSSDSIEERLRALSFLVTLGSIVQPYFEERLNSDDIRLSTMCLIGLGWLGEKDSLPKLIEVLEREEEPEIVKAAAEAISYLEDSSAVPHLLERLSKEVDSSARIALIEAIARLSGPECIDSFIDLLDDRNADVRHAAKEIIERFVETSIPMHDKMSAGERRRIVERFRRWWQENRSRYLNQESEGQEPE